MNTLQVHNSFEPYYAGRNSDNSKWLSRKKAEAAKSPNEDRIETADRRDGPDQERKNKATL
jgi:uncharacterized protein (UPF0303 family)